ncbi:hypothetical protein E7Y32_01710 [Arthrobacter sp. UKPF54-2]|uniref:hypothetical protein n=1 Tax=Arthrobacter sp. UKPF54-2 TaxID=2600159 RepID=UPI0011B1C125|nr:hypothetical protein [Arthrobacter sp. UKPF54-2]QDY89078.1 hypothetical protein E7Y32_01710 [Arthrobacter sp. UKPF54-2]
MVANFLGSLFGGGAAPRSAAVAGAAPTADDSAGDELTITGAALEELRRTVLTNGAKLPPLVVSQVLQITDILRSLIGYIRQSGASTEQGVLLEAVVTDYLPSPLHAYLRLGSASRTDGSTDTTVLLEQLDVLHSTVRNLDNQVRTGAITELAVHGQFLRDKFDIDGLHLEGH